MKTTLRYAPTLLCIVLWSIFISCRNNDTQHTDFPILKNPPASESLNVSTDGDERTPLHFAVIKGDTAEVDKLISNGAIVNVRDINGISPLHLAANNGNTAIIEILTKNGAKVNLKSKYRKVPLHFASGKGHLEAIKALINAGADIDALDDNKNTPVRIAKLYGQTKIVQFFTDRKSGQKITPIRHQFLRLKKSEQTSK